VGSLSRKGVTHARLREFKRLMRLKILWDAAGAVAAHVLCTNRSITFFSSTSIAHRSA
jgi:hypothetical protein